MRRTWIAVLSLLACIGLLSGILAQQQPGGLVTVPVQITDQLGRPVAGLQSKDFMVVENRRALEIRTFARGGGTGSYIIGYLPAPNGGGRPVEVIVALPNVRVTVSADPPANE